jgi:uncharacterized protein (TIGR02996 family)
MPALLHSAVDGPPRPELCALLRAARQRPDDLAVRLVLADWLEEYGDEADRARAEVIRLQCRLEPGACPAPQGECAVLLRRQDRLLSRYATAWLGPIRELGLTPTFRRGMVVVEPGLDAVSRLQAGVLDEAEAWDWVEGIELRAVSRRVLGQLAGCPHLASVTSLAVVGEMGRAEMRSLVGAAWFANLRELDLGGSRVGDEALAVLARAGPPPGLSRLSLCRAGVTRRGVESLLRSESLDGLAALDLNHNRLGDGAVEALADQMRPGGLEQLALAGNGVGGRGCQALADERVSGRLRWLDVSRNPLGAAGAESLTQGGTIGALTGLDASRCQLTTEGMEALLWPSRLPQLEQLWLANNDITDIPSRSDLSRLTLLDLSANPLGEVSLSRLAVRPVPPRLAALSLVDCGVTPAALGALLRSGWLTRPAALDLGENALGAEGIRALSRTADPGGVASLGLSACALDDLAIAQLTKVEWLVGVACLHLEENPIGADGARALARADRLVNLVALVLDGCPVGDAGAAELIDSGALDQLGMLSLRGCDLTDDGVEALALSPGLARISRLALAGPDLGPASVRAILRSPFTDALRVLTFQGTVIDPGLRRDLKQRFGCEATCWPSSA